MTLYESRHEPGGPSPRRRSTSQIADGRLQIDVKIANYRAPGLCLDRHVTLNFPGRL